MCGKCRRRPRPISAFGPKAFPATDCSVFFDRALLCPARTHYARPAVIIAPGGGPTFPPARSSYPMTVNRQLGWQVVATQFPPQRPGKRPVAPKHVVLLFDIKHIETL